MVLKFQNEILKLKKVKTNGSKEKDSPQEEVNREEKDQEAYHSQKDYFSQKKDHSQKEKIITSLFDVIKNKNTLHYNKAPI